MFLLNDNYIKHQLNKNNILFELCLVFRFCKNIKMIPWPVDLDTH